MTKFKVGDQVRAVSQSHGWGKVSKGDAGVVSHTTKAAGNEGYRVNFPRHRSWNASESDLELVAEGGDFQPHHRKTYKQLKDSVTVKKNALWQEACDDGTQEYVLLDESFNRDPRQTQRIYDRSLVEDDPKHFVEVFKVTPEFMTREELDQWESFKKRGSRPAKNIPDFPMVTTPSCEDVVDVFGPRPKRYSSMSDAVLTRFAGVWNSSRSIDSVARKLKLKRSTVLTYRSAAQERGVELKEMRDIKGGSSQSHKKPVAKAYRDFYVAYKRNGSNLRATVKECGVKTTTGYSYLSVLRHHGFKV
ncbi:hypothetical protein [Dietzia natronolimnaea]|uniref:hypothetical protein n=1 Tax=Dietzia natronolimnaea TaxID=161920 RepID=UPI0015FC1873|nr:hypothetical protein [Dietzia natronolimnaea]MBB1037367.1 hypothetical protein [Dietzia natronolimnaea]